MRILSCVMVGGLCLMLCVLPTSAWAESSSANFKLWGSAITGGGQKSTSTNYINFGSVSDFSSVRANSSDVPSSPDYRLYVGFQAIYEEPRITLSLSGTSVVLSPAPLSVGSVSTGSMSVTVSTNADFGYTLTATEIAAFQNQYGSELADVTDTSVTAGSEEYGIAVSGADAAFGNDQPLTSSPLVIASNSLWGASRTTTVTYKAAINPSTDAGSYSGTTIFIATGNY